MVTPWAGRPLRPPPLATPLVTMRYLLRINTSYEHRAKKFERAVLTCVGQDSSEMVVCLRRFFCSLALFSEREWPL